MITYPEIEAFAKKHKLSNVTAHKILRRINKHSHMLQLLRLEKLYPN